MPTALRFRGSLLLPARDRIPVVDPVGFVLVIREEAEFRDHPTPPRTIPGMTNTLSHDPDHHAARMAEALAEVRHQLRMPVPPVPQTSLHCLVEAACGDTGGSQAVRYFLFWLAGQPDPTGFEGAGGLELRRLDGQLRSAALEVLTWWGGPTRSDQPLYTILATLRERFGGR